MHYVKTVPEGKRFHLVKDKLVDLLKYRNELVHKRAVNCILQEQVTLMREQVHQLSFQATKTHGVRLTPENSCWRSRKRKKKNAKLQPRWTEQEDKLLADLYVRLGANCVEEFQKIYPSRSERSIANRRWRIDLVPGGAAEKDIKDSFENVAQPSMFQNQISSCITS